MKIEAWQWVTKFSAAVALAAPAVFAQPVESPERGRTQPEQPIQTEPADAARTVRQVQWSSDAIRSVAEQLAGSWRSATPIAQGVDPLRREEQGPDVRVVMQLAPVNVPRTPDCLYLELTREDALDRPFRQALVQLYEVGGKVRIRTYEIAVPPECKWMLAGLWAIPEEFPRIEPSQLIATADLDVTVDGAGFVAKSRHPYPTRVSGAIEMTSEIRSSGGRLVVLDRGYDGEGKVVWGATDDAGITFDRFEHGIRIEQRQDGIIIIEWEHPEGTPVRPDDLIEWAYEAWVRDSFHLIGSSDRLGATAQWLHPGQQTIRGWRIGGAQATKGTNRTIVIPPASGFPNGMPEIGVPRATLIYHIRCLNIIPQEELPDEGESTGGAGEGPSPSPQP